MSIRLSPLCVVATSRCGRLVGDMSHPTHFNNVLFTFGACNPIRASGSSIVDGRHVASRPRMHSRFPPCIRSVVGSVLGFVVSAFVGVLTRSQEGKCRSREAPDEWQVRHVHADRCLPEVPELVAIVVNIVECEVFGTDGTGDLRGRRCKLATTSLGAKANSGRNAPPQYPWRRPRSRVTWSSRAFLRG